MLSSHNNLVHSNNDNDLTHDLLDAQGVLTKHTFPTIKVDLSCRFSSIELAKLYRMIEAALPNNPHRIVQFVSAYKGEGASEIAMETAILVAKLIGQRVLFIDTSVSQANNQKRKISSTPAISLDTLLINGGSPYDAVARAAGTELYFARLREVGGEGSAPIFLNAIEAALKSLRLNFDLIIVDSQGILSDAFGMVLSKLADGSVMVVEAESTRAPAATECKRLIEDGGGRLIGAVMNRRRLYIPHFLYHLFYRRELE